jgi:hypothetical protein
MTTEASQISRRSFLYLSLTTAVAGVTTGCRLFSFDGGSPLEQAMSGVDLQAARVVGKELASQDARFNDKGYLKQALSLFESSSPAAVDEGATTISKAIVADFRAGRTVKLSGWVLSMTEAHIIALKGLSE